MVGGKCGQQRPEKLVKLSHGLGVDIDPGALERVEYVEEIKVPPSESRLAWLRQHGVELGHPPSRPDVLEGKTHADCLITCERAIIWIEGKRNDWLSPRTKWDADRDQLARNVEAAWIYASENQKDEFCVLLCHEVDLRSEEQALVSGYRSELMAGWPHLDEERRRVFAKRIVL